MKHRWRLDFNFLCGVTAGRWWSLLREERFAVDPAYLHRAAFVTALSVSNSALAAVQRARWGRAIAAVRDVPPPVFVVGHFRQGTTHLHELLAADPRLTFPSTAEVSSPLHFLVSEAWTTRLFAPLLPASRPQDAMPMGFDLPQEDEYALALTSGRSPFYAFVFPRSEAKWLRYLRLRDVPASHVARWQEAMVAFVRRHAARDPRPLVLKSPPHTARVRLLRELFPEARFVHVHRDPYEVFASTRHLVDTGPWFTYLQLPDLAAVDERILRWYTELYDGWFADRPEVPANRVCELSFAELQADPHAALARVYETVELGPFEPARAAVSRHLDRVAAHARNRYPSLTTAERARVAAAWGRSFAAWGYPVD